MCFENLKLFSYSSCSTCRRAIKWLKTNDITFELIDLLQSPPSKEMLISAFELYGDRKFLLNTSGIIYRSIGSDVVKKMTDNELLEQLIMEPRLIKRPFLYKSSKCLLVGFKEENWAEKLL
ncbi:Spx/MgsR family RNA polymerase-binding regulatory protein [Prochlorococcus marinus]|uniref:Spx/MgsR family RNA polymerase-binding regulatory protein n=1 Tax=Prochlorococcus marinus TaxID=1219 RepID=UPI0022B34E06|nr:Spx/MgsR family RNA polymerase-binding regulatory protein [Prochlorococcus marinus]